MYIGRVPSTDPHPIPPDSGAIGSLLKYIYSLSPTFC